MPSAFYSLGREKYKGEIIVYIDNNNYVDGEDSPKNSNQDDIIKVCFYPVRIDHTISGRFYKAYIHSSLTKITSKSMTIEYKYGNYGYNSFNRGNEKCKSYCYYPFKAINSQTFDIPPGIEKKLMEEFIPCSYNRVSNRILFHSSFVTISNAEEDDEFFAIL